MGDAIRVSGPINAAGLEMSMETGKLASLAAGAVVVKVGDTVVLSTVATSKPREGIDFFPLTVDVEERMYAAGKIPGSFFRREGRPSETAILTCRLIDRPLRPTFRDGFRDEVQVINTILGVDGENPYDVPAMNGSSLATMLAGLPFDGPVGSVRMGLIGETGTGKSTFSDLLMGLLEPTAGAIAIDAASAGIKNLRTTPPQNVGDRGTQTTASGTRRGVGEDERHGAWPDGGPSSAGTIGTRVKGNLSGHRVGSATR